MSFEKGKPRLYFSSRKGSKPPIPLYEAHSQLETLYGLYRDKEYFRQKLGTGTRYGTSEEQKRLALIRLGFPAFPLGGWSVGQITEDHIFDVIEFLFDHASKPGSWNPDDECYESFDDAAGKEEFRSSANSILAQFGEGFELGEDGQIRAHATGGLEHIIGAQIVPFDDVNVDSKVRAAIEKWRKRHPTLEDKKEAIRLLADVFEWLQKTKHLEKALASKDESDLFNIANNFAIRHHRPAQKGSYDQSIWYNWIFHFYLATYHAAIRLLIRQQPEEPNAPNKQGKHVDRSG